MAQVAMFLIEIGNKFMPVLIAVNDEEVIIKYKCGELASTASMAMDNAVAMLNRPAEIYAIVTDEQWAGGKQGMRKYQSSPKLAIEIAFLEIGIILKELCK